MKMTTRRLALGSLFLVALVMGACSSPTAPEDTGLPTDVAPYHYSVVPGLRFYEVTYVPPIEYKDTLVDTLVDTLGDTTFDTSMVVTDRLMDTLFDSTYRRSVSGGVFWTRAFREFRRYARDSLGDLIPDTLGEPVLVSQWAAHFRQEGRVSESLFVDPSLQYLLLEAPLAPGKTWTVDAGGAILAKIAGEETLPLPIGPVRCWHVLRTIGDEWWAPGLGRVQYEEVVPGGARIRARLFAIGPLL